MPPANRFRHQSYTPARPAAPLSTVHPGGGVRPGSGQFRRRMEQVGDEFRDAGVRAVYLTHGCFVGWDALGVLAELGRTFPDAAQRIRPAIKRAVGSVTGEMGNYTDRFVWLFESSINRPGTEHVPVRLFDWSGENHHLGRADGAVRLIHELASLDLEPGSRVQLWGHSHAGNVFALLTNLLGSGPEDIERFFQAAEIYYRWPLAGCIDIPLWSLARQLLLDRPPALDGLKLDIVTFGTPVRYGWDSGGYSRLLHFVHRRAGIGRPAHRAEFPPRLEDVLNAADGDYIQQLAIAGTNLGPSLLAWRAWLADRRLNELLQANLVAEEPLAHFRAGKVVPDEGTTLLVDYGAAGGDAADHHAGHAVYTAAQWLPFHAEEVARRFYARARAEAA